jgi:3-oxoacyl-[acyl-carrier protein] reductase
VTGRLEGKVAIITGSARGIGFGIAEAFCQEGAKVVLNDADLEPLEVARKSISDKGWPVVACHASVGTVEAGESLVGTALDAFDRIDVLVNNAGILRDRMLHNMTELEFDDVIRVSLRGTWACTRALVRHWRPLAKAELESGQAKPRKVINVTSASGLLGAVGQSNYAAAKLGVVGLTKSWARELGPYGITVNAVAPLARTRLTAPLLEDEADARERVERLALRRYGRVDDVTPVYLFLASPASDYLTGQVINVDGGLVI